MSTALTCVACRLSLALLLYLLCARSLLQLIGNLIVSDDDTWKRTGVVTCQFYKNGDWVTVTCDTKLPYGDTTNAAFNNPIYGHCRDLSEQWVAFVEKAYAKLHGTYENLNGGSVAEALVDFTGGVSEKFLLTDPHVKAMVDNGELWTRLKKYLKANHLLGCSMSKHGGGFETDSGSGILMNHAYTILHLKTVGALRLVKIRNPWGHGEWRGDWSDNWENWDQHPDVESALMDDEECQFNRNDADGTFWMVWEDFVAHYNKIYLCRVFGEEYNQYVVNGRWEGLSAAGSHKVMEDRDGDGEEKAADEGSKVVKRQDGDPQWFHNPQFRITSHKEGKACISLMQADRMLTARENVAIRFVVLRQPRNSRSRVWEEDPSEIVADSSKANFANAFAQREVSHPSVVLDPAYSYIVVPHTMQRGVELDFSLRIFSELELTVDPLPEPYGIELQGTWARDSAGGPRRVDGRSNPSWCLNPQFWVTLPPGVETKRKSTLKLVLTRTDRNAGRDDKSDGTKNRVGVVVTRVMPAPVDNPRRKRPGQPRTNAMGEVLPSKESSLKRPLGGTMGSTAGAGAAEPPKPKEQPKRKLDITSDEYSLSSYFTSAKVATTLLKVPPDWLQDGLLVHPCMKLVGREGDFTLQLFSETKLMMQELAAGRTRTVTGSWSDKNAVGCHLHAEWKRNPAFVVKNLGPPGPVEAKITLTRPEERWRSAARADSVGCMIGFYIVTCDRERDSKFNDGRRELFQEVSFVPMHQVTLTTTLRYDLLPEGKVFLVVPATFEPEKEGPFHLTVSMDSDFTLKPHKT